MQKPLSAPRAVILQFLPNPVWLEYAFGARIAFGGQTVKSRLSQKVLLSQMDIQAVELADN